MVQTANQNWPFVVNLGNSIIGVAVLAMPFCFKQCGILLAVLVLLLCTWLTLASCQLLVKAGIVSHYRSYEFLAFHTYGAPGKFLVEIGMIGMQLGTLVAQIVVIGDLGPPIVSHLLGIENNPRTRLYLIVVLCLMVGLPLGLMKDLRNVSRASTICIMFYAVFSFYILWMSSGNLLTAEWYSHVHFWRPQGLFQCLPILSFSFGCQTQLFILYDALPEPSLHAIKSIIHSAVNLCAVTYLLVGFFGYVTFYHVDIPGDIITVFPATLGTHLTKLGFVLSIAITFPVIIYPCRASIYTLMFQKKLKPSDDMASTYIPEFLFKCITIAIVVGSMITGILIPNVEFILGLNGAITGTLICYIFPALFFLRVMSSKAEGKIIAQIVLLMGVSILLISTFTTLNAQDKGHIHEDVQKAAQEAADKVKVQGGDLPHIDADNSHKKTVPPQLRKEEEKKDEIGRRVEPPNPNAPGPNEKVALDIKADEKQSAKEKPAKMEEVAKKAGRKDKNGDAAAGDKDDGEEMKRKDGGEEQEKRQEQLLEALEAQRREQEKLLQEQKALLQELKDHKDQEHQPQGQNLAQQAADHLQVQGQQQGQGQQLDALQNVQQQQGVQQNMVPQGVLKQDVVAQEQVMQAKQSDAHIPLVNNNQAPQLGVQDYRVKNNQFPQAQNPVMNNPAHLLNLKNTANQAQKQLVQNPALNNQAQQFRGENTVIHNQAQPLEQNLAVNNNQGQPVVQNAAMNNQGQPVVQNPAVNDQVQPLLQNPAGNNNQGQLPVQNPAMNNQGQPLVQNPAVNNQGQPLVQNPAVNNQGQPLVQNPVVNNNQGQPLVQNPAMNNQGQPLVQNPAMNNQGQPLVQNPAMNNQGQPVVQNPAVINQGQPVVQNPALNDQAQPLVQNLAENKQQTLPAWDGQQWLAAGVGQGVAPVGAQQMAPVRAQPGAPVGAQGMDAVREQGQQVFGQGVAAARVQEIKVGANGKKLDEGQLGDKELLRKKRETGQDPLDSEWADPLLAVLNQLQPKEHEQEAAGPEAHSQSQPEQQRHVDKNIDPEVDSVLMDTKVGDKGEEVMRQVVDKLDVRADTEVHVADVRKEEMRKLKSLTDERGQQGGFNVAPLADSLQVDSFVNVVHQGLVIQSLKSKGR